MAIDLNKNRIFLSNITAVCMVILILFTKSFIAKESALHELLESVGVTLISLCVMGRILSSCYLGGFKNNVMITHGIYSVMRNPLYFFSLIGVTGAGVISGHIIVMIALPLLFLMIYLPLIKREEKFLEEKFGAEYIAYKQKVPALFPNFFNYHAPETLTFYPRFLMKAFKDAIGWLAILPCVELIEYLHAIGTLPTFFVS